MSFVAMSKLIWYLSVKTAGQMGFLVLPRDTALLFIRTIAEIDVLESKISVFDIALVDDLLGVWSRIDKILRVQYLLVLRSFRCWNRGHHVDLWLQTCNLPLVTSFDVLLAKVVLWRCFKRFHWISFLEASLVHHLCGYFVELLLAKHWRFCNPISLVLIISYESVCVFSKWFVHIVYSRHIPRLLYLLIHLNRLF